MRFFRAQLFLLVITLVHVVTATGETWSFKNWNKFKDAKTDGDNESWFKAWGIAKSDGWSWPHKGDSVSNHKIVKDPAKTGEEVLQVAYPKGSSNPGGSTQGGIGFYAQPLHLRNEAKTVVLEYSVYFPKKFQFVKGGKLPGLYGGHEGCSGGADADTCFSTRFMWRREGDGEVYAYLPESKQRDGLCDEEGNICNKDYGYSLGRGSWSFKTGKWIKVRQTLKLNSPGKDDGMVSVDVDGKNVYTEKKLAFLNKDTGKVVGVAFHTFFGGNGSAWAPKKKEYSYFKGFSLKAQY
ncbi:hypothetical protein BDB00DRAFT_980116 [Zychaea mexicana]|uniref:uncharacterized protein n=1 Tax=Zychaea mexicana TaxID=64656 RepID=UPI0022FDF51E|nr:uncharacterized protein BDB00DRAFT_980116 [Zychaea mexicana]KAI9490048.1 hypothetical protein BDB00DRAFT_980116 [Zychaea mexicana]